MTNVVTTAYINGAGRLKIDNRPEISAVPREIVEGLYCLPIDADISRFTDPAKLTKPEFITAARDLGVGGAYGGPAFGALAKHMIKDDPELRKLYQYAFASDWRGRLHFLLGTEQTADALSSGDKIVGMTSKRRLVAMAVVGLLSDEELERAAQELTGASDADVKALVEELHMLGYGESTRRIFDSQEVLKSTHARDRIIVVLAGQLIASTDRAGFLEYTASSRPHIVVDAGATIEGYVPTGGCCILEAIKTPAED